MWFRWLGAVAFAGSMGRKSQCYDNAEMEAFWSTLKREATETKGRLRRELIEYIEATYNQSRPHSSLVCQSPVDLKQQKK